VEVDLDVVDPVAGLAQQRDVHGHLGPLRLPQRVVRGPRPAPLVLDRDDGRAAGLEEVELGGEPETLRRQAHRGRRRRVLAAVGVGQRRREAARAIDAAVDEASLDRVGVVEKRRSTHSR